MVFDWKQDSGAIAAETYSELKGDYDLLGSITGQKDEEQRDNQAKQKGSLT